MKPFNNGLMKINSIKKVKLEKPIPVFDIYNSEPYHNFLIKTKTGYIVSHNCAMLDELDFAKGQDAALEKSAIMKLYNSVKRRIESRFMRNGKVPGLLFLVSSKNNVYDFLETYIAKNRYNPKLLIVDEPLWVVKKSVGGYSGKTFKLAVGDRYFPSRILTERDDVEKIAESQRVIDVPIEHKEAFQLNINLALADIAGIAIVSASKFFNIEKVLDTYRDYLHNPFIQEEISLGFDDSSALKDYIDMKLLPSLNRGTQSYHIHWDVSKNGDRTGLSMTTSSDHKKVNRLVNGEVVDVVDVIHKIVFAVAISARPGEEIPFYKIREFIYWLRDIGFNIMTITCDSYQCLCGKTIFYVYDTDKKLFRNRMMKDLREGVDKVFAYDTDKDKVVLTHFKNLRITGRVKKIYKITTYEGETVFCTGNHPFLTPKGYVRAEHVKKKDLIINKRSEFFNVSEYKKLFGD